jgi:hypothetical protein
LSYITYRSYENGPLFFVGLDDGELNNFESYIVDVCPFMAILLVSKSEWPEFLLGLFSFSFCKSFYPILLVLVLVILDNSNIKSIVLYQIINYFFSYLPIP